MCFLIALSETPNSLETFVYFYAAMVELVYTFDLKSNIYENGLGVRIPLAALSASIKQALHAKIWKFESSHRH